MYNVQIITAGSKLIRKALAMAALCALAMSFVAVGAAHADTKEGNGTTKGCLIENDGHLERVAVGSKIGLLTCGSDGEWHFGWLINAITVHPKSIKPTATTFAIRHRAPLVAAKVSR